MNEMSFRKTIIDLEEAIKSGGESDGIKLTPLSITELGLQEHFIPGVYIREVFIPAGVVVTGRVHKTEHFCIVIGECEIASIEGKHIYYGFNRFKSMPGVKRAVYAFTDTHFMTIHRTDETDKDKLVELMTSADYAEYDKYLECLT